MRNTNKLYALTLVISFLLISCSESKEEKQVALYNTYCSSCHLAPNIDDLPKHLWANQVLPAMAARMGIYNSENHPYKKLSFNEQSEIIKAGIFPSQPTIALEDWELLKSYILTMASDSSQHVLIKKKSKPLTQFTPRPLSIDSINGSLITSLTYDGAQNKVVVGTVRGELRAYNFETHNINTLGRFGSAISSYTENEQEVYVTTMGNLLPSEIASGSLLKKTDGKVMPITQGLHRPVHTLVHDFNKDGKPEMVISEFGDLKGKLSILFENENATYDKHILIHQPGAIRVVARDMNADGKDDIVALFSQGDENISILYQTDDLKFEAKRVLRFSPLSGSSWFELIDFDADGDLDIITVNGDNADETYIMKHNHGMRIHINDGADHFKESYFYPMDGVTTVIVKDFDQDDDMDIALLSTFPDYKNNPEFSFVYLDTKNADKFDFQAHTFEGITMGKWFTMDSGDVDKDGDLDIILGALTYGFSPVPKELAAQWKGSNIDILVLENNLKN